jgi:hypothetical protein
MWQHMFTMQKLLHGFHRGKQPINCFSVNVEIGLTLNIPFPIMPSSFYTTDWKNDFDCPSKKH